MKALIKTLQGVLLQEKDIPILLNEKCVLIKVILAGVCRADLYVAQNKIAASEGVTLGHEFCGIIEKVGPEVQHLSVGQRVGVMPVFIEDDGYTMLGVNIDGAYADTILVPAEYVYPVPENHQ